MTISVLYGIIIKKKTLVKAKGVTVTEVRYVNKDDDLNAISAIYEVSWRHTYKGMLPSGYLKHIPEGNWSDRINRFGSHSLVMVNNSEYIATISFGASTIGSKYSGWGEIFSLYVLPQYTGKGIGKLIMDRTLSELKDMGFRQVVLAALDKNTIARHFYEKYGFVMSGDMMKLKIGRKTVTEVMYTLDLNV